MRKIQINVTEYEADILATYATQLGYDLKRYVKYLVSVDVMRSFNRHEIPTFQMSKATEKRMSEAMEEYKQGKTKTVKSMSELLDR